jgi:Peptidase inhibitor family I36
LSPRTYGLRIIAGAAVAGAAVSGGTAAHAATDTGAAVAKGCPKGYYCLYKNAKAQGEPAYKSSKRQMFTLNRSLKGKIRSVRNRSRIEVWLDRPDGSGGTYSIVIVKAGRTKALTAAQAKKVTHVTAVCDSRPGAVQVAC